MSKPSVSAAPERAAPSTNAEVRLRGRWLLVRAASGC
jgi:hypothetical protein